MTTSLPTPGAAAPPPSEGGSEPDGGYRVVRRRRSPAAAPGRFAHIRALDGLRGLAVLLVVLSHFAPGIAAGGFLGVDLFFVLSGFLITSLLVTEVRSSTHVALGNFWIRRARRLFPALLLVVAVVLVVTWITGAPDQVHRVGADGLAAVFYVANWRFILSGQSYIRQFLDVAPSPLRHTWSLAIEEQFYLVWPLVVVGLTALLRRIGGRHGVRTRIRRWLALLSLGLAGVSFAWLVAAYHRGFDLDRLYYGTDTRVFLILLGAALGAATAGVPTVPAHLKVARGALLVAGTLGTLGLLVLTVVAATDQPWLYAGGFGAIGVTLVVVLAAAAQPGPNPLAAALQWRPLVGLGLISYGIYLWHWPIEVWVRPGNTGLDGPALFLVRCALTLGVALLSYRFVEQPIRRGTLPRVGPVPAWLTSVIVVLGLVVSLAVPVVIYPGVASAPKGPPVDEATRRTAAAYEAAVRCDGPPGTRDIRSGDRLLIQIEGNSLAGEITNCLTAILKSRGADVERVDPPGFLLCRDLPLIEDQVRNPSTKPDAAVVFLFTAYDDRCGTPWHRAVDDLIAMYQRYGVHVYLVPSVPIVPGGRDDLAPGPMLEAEYYRQIAAADPERLTFVDAGPFLRDAAGTYRWRMPCLAAGEPGCGPDDTVGVRFVDGLHFCTDPQFAARGCPEAQYQAGQRRAAAGIAATLLPSLERRYR